MFDDIDEAIDEAIERADRESFTREPPKSLAKRIEFLLEHMKTAKAVGEAIGVTADSVNRYRRGARKHPPEDIAGKIDDAVRSRWQPRVRKRLHKRAMTTAGVKVNTRAQIGYKGAPVKTTDDGRFRRLNVRLPPAYAQRLFDARERGDSEQTMQEIVADGIREVYFQDGGRRARDLTEIEIKNIDYLDIEF